MEWYDSGAGDAPCWGCGREVSVPARREFAGLAERPMTGEVYCRSCREIHLPVCTECSTRYAAGGSGLCDMCAERIWMALEEPW